MTRVDLPMYQLSASTVQVKSGAILPNPDLGRLGELGVRIRCTAKKGYELMDAYSSYYDNAKLFAKLGASGGDRTRVSPYPEVRATNHYTTKALELFFNLRFTDDIVILSNSIAEAETVLVELSVAGKKIELQVNREKTQFMKNAWCKEHRIILDID